MKTEEPLFDVVAVNIKTGAERHLDTGKTERNADAIVSMAVMRRGVDEEFFKTVPAGTPLAADQTTRVLNELRAEIRPAVKQLGAVLRQGMAKDA